MVTTRIAGIGVLLLLVTAGTAGASPQLGWCLGVGNPHQSAHCGDSNRPPVTNPVNPLVPPGGTQGPGQVPDVPTVTQLPQVPQEPVPQTIVLPVTPGGQIPPTGPGQGPVIQPQTPLTTVTITGTPGPGVTTVTPGGGPVQLPPVVVTLPPEPRPIPPGGGTTPAVTALAVPPLTYVSHQITVGTVNVPQIVVNATGPGAQAVPGQIILTPIAIPVPQPPAGTVAPPRQPSLVPPRPGTVAVPQGTPTAQTPGAVLVPVLIPSLPGDPGQTPQGVPNPQQPGQVLVPVLIPPLPGGTQPTPQGTPGAQLPTQVLVPILTPPVPPQPNPVPQGVPKPQANPALQPPPLRPTITLRPQPPQVIATLVFPRPKPRPVLVPPTTILQPTVTRAPTVTRPPIGTGQIAARPGRHAGGAHPAFADPAGGGNWNCVASGMGVRQVLKGGRLVTTGVQRHAGNVDALGRDVPAKHPKHPHCIISVQRRDGG